MHICPNDKKYIGITCQNYKRRWSNGNGYKSNKHFHNAIKKYGWENIKHEILSENLSESEAKKMEVMLISEYKTHDQNFGYNKTFGGEGTVGYIHSEETKNKIGVANSGNSHWKGRFHSQESKEKMSKSKIGKEGHAHTNEFKLFMSSRMRAENNPMYGISRRGEDSPMYGRHHTEETREKIRMRTSGENNPMFGTTGENCPNYGKHLSDETKDKIRKSMIGKYQIGNKTEEEKKVIYGKIGKANSGKNNPSAKQIICINSGEIFEFAKQASEKYNIDLSNIIKCCRGKYKSAGKHPDTGEPLVWEYYKNI